MDVSHSFLPSSSSDLSTTQSFSQSSVPLSTRLTERHFPGQIPNRPNGKPGQRNCIVCSLKCGRRRKKTTYFLVNVELACASFPVLNYNNTKVDPGRLYQELAKQNIIFDYKAHQYYTDALS